MPSFKRSDLVGDIQVFQPQGVETLKSSEAVTSYIRAGGHTENSSFVIDSRVSDRIGLTDMKKSDEKKNFDGEVMRYVQKIKDGAFQEAYDKGLLEGQTKAKEAALAEARQEIADQLAALAAICTKLQSNVDNSYVTQEQEIIDFCYLMAQKIVYKELEKDPELIKHSIKKILQVNESQKDKMIIKVSQGDYDFIQSHAKEMAPEVDLTKSKMEAAENLSPGDIIIESPQGIVDGTMKTRIEKLNQILENPE